MPLAEEGFEPLQIGRGELLADGDDLLIVAYGAMVSPAMATAGLLQEQGIRAAVINARFLRPLDEALILPMARRIGRVVTMEEGCSRRGLRRRRGGEPQRPRRAGAGAAHRHSRLLVDHASPGPEQAGPGTHPLPDGQPDQRPFRPAPALSGPRPGRQGLSLRRNKPGHQKQGIKKPPDGVIRRLSLLGSRDGQTTPREARPRMAPIPRM